MAMTRRSDPLTRCARKIQREEPLSHYEKEMVAKLLYQCVRVMDRETPLVTCPGAEHGLDVALRQLLPNDPVVYVDVGAAEPIECSNTWQFYEKGGYGLLIEPMPFCWYPILLQRQRDKLYPKAVSREEGWARFHLCGSCSSLDPEWTQEKRGEITVQTEPLKSILEKFPDIAQSASLCSIDVEGGEENVIESADWSVFHPKVVVIEYKMFEDSKQSESAARAERIMKLMESRGYREHWRTALNIVFSRTES